MCKSRGDGCPAVDACEFSVFLISAQLQRFFYDRGKILILSDMGDSGIRDNFCREYTVLVAALRRHQSVGREQDRRRDVREFFLLVMPCGPEIPFQMRISL